MASVDKSAYSGSWSFNQRPVIKYTPDLLVFVNGDTSVPGCSACRGRIEIQRHVTSVSVDAGTEATSHSATISLSLPKTQGQQLFIDGHFILQPGLEVNIYMRGYFPLKGGFSGFTQSGFVGDGAEPGQWPTFPYYPVFHGIVTNVSYSYADGSYTGSVSCSSLLHFWQYVNISTSAAHLATKPTNDPSRPTLFGHTFNNMHPFGIMYTLYRDTAGAAAGVEFALSGQSNVDASAGGVAAAASDGGRQLYDHVALYWEQRFKTRVQNLRMYGVNGRLFNAAQQAYLGSASNRDLSNLLPSTQYGDSKGQRPEIDPFSVNFSIAKTLGLSDGGIDVTFASFATEGSDLASLNLLDMFAFTQGIGEVGSVNLWETTYQTKIDIANSVVDITGYEFYQDVDGDLVFKPPFYNLDTATNRIYRLEDTDIININFDQKEPQATYINVRGTWFKGWSDIVPNDSATAKRSVYVDYKLVAKFGWRQASLDVTYTTDPRMLFFIGLARLDRLNIDVNSASCTIPIRPELRPGYPVYIPFVDSYYYVSQISHSFSFGGQCTTTLTLTCRRSKFYAPGYQERPAAGDNAIWKIRLDRPDLPPRPLEIYEQNSFRLVGFPNVVLGLDPTKANPSFFPVGAGIDYLGSIEDIRILFNAIREDLANLSPGILQVAPAYVDAEGRLRPQVPTEELRYRLQTGPNPEDFVEFGLNDLIEGFSDLQSLRNRVQSLETDLAQQRADLAAAIEKDNKFVTVESRTQGQLSSNPNIDSLRLEETRLQKELQFAQGSLDQYTGSEGGNRNLLLQVFSAIQKFRGNPSRRKLEDSGADVSAAFFESLMHLKSQYLADNLPGRYRYFSSAHPDPNMQGQPVIIWDDGNRPKAAPQAPVTSGTTKTSTPVRPSSRKTLKQLAQKLHQAIESNFSIPGWSNFALAFIKEESNYNSSASNPALGGKVSALVGGTSAPGIKQDRAERVQKNIQEAHPDNPYVNDPEHWGELGAAGWYQMLATSAMPAFSKKKGSRYSSTDPQIVQTDPVYATAAFGNLVRRTIRNPRWVNLPPEDKTWLNLRRAVGGPNVLKRAVSKGFISKKWGAEEARAILVDDSGKNAKLRFRDPDTGEKVPRDEIFGRGYNQAGRFLRGLINGAGLTLEEGVAFMNSQVPEALQGLPAKNADTLLELLFSASEAPATEPLAPPSSPKTQDQLPQEDALPQIRTQAITVNPRSVIQFLPTVTRPSTDVRYPEAEIGIGLCSQGLNIVQGPGYPPRPLTTDQVQTLSFARFSASKFAEVIGTSAGSGKLTFDAQAFYTRVSEQFMSAVQSIQDPTTQTPSDLFQTIYEAIKESVESVEIPSYTRGQQTGTRTLSLPSFEDAIPSPEVPSFLETVFSGNAVPIATTTISNISLLPGYTSPGKTSDDGQSLGPTLEKIASGYTNAIVSEVSAAFSLSQEEILNPSEGKAERQGSIANAYNNILRAATGETDALTIDGDDQQAKTFYPGKIERPIHAPVFPVSDEKGYEHYGAYRYGRGLSIDPGGTFAFVHQSNDPFANVSAQTAELFLQALTAIKTQRAATAPLRGFAQTAETTARKTSEAIRASILGEAEVNQEVPEQLVQQASQEDESFEEVQLVAQQLSKTPRGQEALRELLSANGDNPNLIENSSWDVSDTQFARGFSNFSANYALSSSFKTTVANVAYQLADITAHIHAEDNISCTCRGSLADVLLQAYSRTEFLAVEGVAQDNPGDAYSSELMLREENAHKTQVKSLTQT